MHTRHNNPANFIHHNGSHHNQNADKIIDDPIRNRSYLSSYGKNIVEK